jgi:cytochrome b6-f complex iron-sulfur subunit
MEPNRRCFLKSVLTGLTAAVVALATWGVARFSLFGIGTRRTREVPEEVLSKLQPDVPQHVAEAAAWLRRDSEGNLTALDDRCPHLGCRQKWNPGIKRYQCPCHGSEFDIDGNVLSGPAAKAMPRLTVDRRDKDKIRLFEKT